jgi:hypothetical protein
MDLGNERSAIDLGSMPLERRVYWEAKIRSINSMTTDDLKLELVRSFEEGLHQQNRLNKAARESLGIPKR